MTSYRKKLIEVGAIVEVEDGAAKEAVYVKGYDFGQPGFGQTYSAYRLVHGRRGIFLGKTRVRS